MIDDFARILGELKRVPETAWVVFIKRAHGYELRLYDLNRTGNMGLGNISEQQLQSIVAELKNISPIHIRNGNEITVIDQRLVELLQNKKDTP